jgi:hypothetical protein
LHGLLAALKPDVNFCHCPIFGHDLRAWTNWALVKPGRFARTRAVDLVCRGCGLTSGNRSHKISLPLGLAWCNPMSRSCAVGYFIGRISNMADGVPLSAEVTRALSRCAVTSGTVGLWESLLLGAVKR